MIRSIRISKRSRLRVLLWNTAAINHIYRWTVPFGKFSCAAESHLSLYPVQLWNMTVKWPSNNYIYFIRAPWNFDEPSIEWQAEVASMSAAETIIFMWMWYPSTHNPALFPSCERTNKRGKGPPWDIPPQLPPKNFNAEKWRQEEWPPHPRRR